jgi:hypothetical protein
MEIFNPIELSWGGKDYKVPANRVLEAVCVCEEEVTLHELAQYAQRETAPAGRLAKAYGAVLRYAGCQVTNDEVFSAMFRQSSADRINLSIQTLLMAMMPKDMLVEKASSRGNVSGVAGKSSKKRTRRQ